MGRRRRYKSLQLPQFRGFCLVATQGSFTAAAQLLGVSVSTVWEQVRALERKLGVPLVRQRGRVLELTEEGRLLLDLIHPHISALDSIEGLFESRRVELPQRLTVASTHYLLTYHLPEVVGAFTAEHPAVRINLRASLSPEIAPLVEQGAAGLGLVPGRPEEPRNPSLNYEPLFKLQLMLLTSVRHPLARRKRLEPHDLVRFPLILPPKESHAYRVLERLLQEHDLTRQMHVVLESRSVDMSRQYAALGIGIALAYVAPWARLALPGLHIRPFDPKMEGLPVMLVFRKHAHLTPPLLEFRRTLERFLPHSCPGND